MKLLLITDLYPKYPGQSRIEESYAIHDLISASKDKMEIAVVRPVIIKNPFSILKYRKILNFNLDGVRVFNCPVFKIPKLPVFFIRNIFKCLDSIKLEPEVVSAHLGFNLQIGYMISLKLDIPLISGIHMGDLHYTWKMTGMKKFRKIIEHSIGIACRSPLIKKEFSNRFPEFQDKVFTANSGINSNYLLKNEQILKKAGQWIGDADVVKRIVSASRLDKNKNIDKILYALSGINKKIKWKYTIAGEGIERRRLERLAEKLGIKDKVEFTGLISHEKVLELFENSHVFIMISNIETFGMAFLEAMAKGNIVIGSKNTGIDGFIENNKNGFIIDPNLEGELTTVLNRIFLNRSLNELKTILLNSFNKISRTTDKISSENYFNNIKKAYMQKK